MALSPSDLQKIQTIVRQEVQNEIKPLDKKVDGLGKKVDKGFKQIKKQLSESFDYLDKKYIKTHKRLKSIESNLSFPAQEL